MRRKFLILPKAKAFTLVEVMVTTAILAFGIVSIYEALFVSTDVFGYYMNYLHSQDWMDEKIVQAQEQLTQAKTFEADKAAGRFVRGNKTFGWFIMVNPVDEEAGLYKIDLTLSWKQGRKDIDLSRSAYLLSPRLKEYNEENLL